MVERQWRYCEYAVSKRFGKAALQCLKISKGIAGFLSQINLPISFDIKQTDQQDTKSCWSVAILFGLRFFAKDIPFHRTTFFYFNILPLNACYCNTFNEIALREKEENNYRYCEYGGCSHQKSPFNMVSLGECLQAD